VNLTNRFTTGCKTIAIIVAKTRGIIIPLAMYNTNTKAINPIKMRGAFILVGILVTMVDMAGPSLFDHTNINFI